MTDKKLLKRIETQSSIINRQSEQIKCLKNQIDELFADIARKDELIKSITDLHGELIETVDDLKDKKEQYDGILSDLNKIKRHYFDRINHKRGKPIR